MCVCIFFFFFNIFLFTSELLSLSGSKLPESESILFDACLIA